LKNTNSSTREEAAANAAALEKGAKRSGGEMGHLNLPPAPQARQQQQKQQQEGEDKGEGREECEEGEEGEIEAERGEVVEEWAINLR